jgi:hypothetical protein
MVLINQLLGNEKTDLTIEVEKLIWEALFTLAEGRVDPAQILRGLCHKLPWKEIAVVAANPHAEDRVWFNIREWINRPKSHITHEYRTLSAQCPKQPTGYSTATTRRCQRVADGISGSIEC